MDVTTSIVLGMCTNTLAHARDLPTDVYMKMLLSEISCSGDTNASTRSTSHRAWYENNSFVYLRLIRSMLYRNGHRHSFS